MFFRKIHIRFIHLYILKATTFEHTSSFNFLDIDIRSLSVEQRQFFMIDHYVIAIILFLIYLDWSNVAACTAS